jgi:hypothetical protein
VEKTMFWIRMLHDAIASDAEQPKMEDVEHAFENFHSSRVIRKLIIDGPAFAVTLWEKALQGKCKIWAHGHRYVVLDVLVPPEFMTACVFFFLLNHANVKLLICDFLGMLFFISVALYWLETCNMLVIQRLILLA